MEDPDTFLTLLHVMIDDLCKQHQLSLPKHRGPAPKLGLSELITLVLFGQWARFASERVLPLCPTPSQNRLSNASRSQPIRATRTGMHTTHYQALRVCSAIQLVSQVAPPSKENACCQRAVFSVMLSHRKRTRMGTPSNVSIS